MLNSVQCSMFYVRHTTPNPEPPLKFGGELLDLERLDDIAGLDVVVILQADTAFVTAGNFLLIVLEAAQRGHLPFVDHYVVAQQAYLGVAQHLAVLDVTAAHVADLGYREDLADFRPTQVFFLQGRGKQAFHGLFDILDRIVNDAVESDIDPFLLRQSLGLDLRTDVEADDD